jgi:hypothetical protein
MLLLSFVAVCVQLALLFIYLLLRLEGNALLVGAVASFLAVAAVMYFTRNIDWYGSIAAGGGRASEGVEKDAGQLELAFELLEIIPAGFELPRSRQRRA